MRAGAHVIIGCRSIDKAAKAEKKLKRIRGKNGGVSELRGGLFVSRFFFRFFFVVQNYISLSA